MEYQGITRVRETSTRVYAARARLIDTLGPIIEGVHGGHPASSHTLIWGFKLLLDYSQEEATEEAYHGAREPEDDRIPKEVHPAVPIVAPHRPNPRGSTP